MKVILVQYRDLKNARRRPASTLSVIIIDRLSDDQILKMRICSPMPRYQFRANLAVVPFHKVFNHFRKRAPSRRQSFFPYMMMIRMIIVVSLIYLKMFSGHPKKFFFEFLIFVSSYLDFSLGLTLLRITRQPVK